MVEGTDRLREREREQERQVEIGRVTARHRHVERERKRDGMREMGGEWKSESETATSEE